ncbi:MAG: hypothetical protein LBR18_03310 [Tannerella sp.]|jgi:hypothetical protein|nr:hypothetical protein [Tannerella sp.]
MRKGLFLVFVWLGGLSAVAQNSDLYRDYVVRTGENAAIFSGQIKADYNRFFYDNTPYYLPDFADAYVVYNGNPYPAQKILLDLYSEQAIIMSPQRSFGILLDSEKTDTVKFTTNNATFVWLKPPTGSGLNKGFYRLMLQGDEISLFCKDKYLISKMDLLEHFYLKQTYYVLKDGTFCPVKNKRSFRKLFPKYKKLINQFSKKSKLNFVERREDSLIKIADYCDELLKQEATQ